MRNVKIHLVLFSSIYFYSLCRAETPSILSVDLCNKKYDGQEKNVCCILNKNQRPTTNENCKAYNKDIDDFRQEVLYLHNYYRNSSATHRDSNLTTTRPGSNMNAVSYDLNLEYLAWCNAMRCKFQHDQGHGLPGIFKQVGQNIGYNSHTFYATAVKRYAASITDWWTENELILDGVLDHYNGTWKKPGTTRHIGHYTQMVWWSVTHIGCARSTWHDKALKMHTIYIVCNYGSTIASSNLQRAVVYARGPPCTACKNVGTKCCNREFPGLCGPIAPIPTGWTPDDDISSKRRRRESILTFHAGQAQATTTPEPPDFMLAAGVKAPECPLAAPAPAQTTTAGAGPSGSQAITTESQPQDNDSHEMTEEGGQAVNNAANSSSGAIQIQNFHSANFIVFFIFVFGAVIFY